RDQCQARASWTASNLITAALTADHDAERAQQGVQLCDMDVQALRICERTAIRIISPNTITKFLRADSRSAPHRAEDSLLDRRHGRQLRAHQHRLAAALADWLLPVHRCNWQSWNFRPLNWTVVFGGPVKRTPSAFARTAPR